MLKASVLLFLLTLSSFDAFSMGSPKPKSDESSAVNWNILTKSYNNMPIHYTSFFVDGKTIRFFGGGGGVDTANGLHEYTGSFSAASTKRTIVSTGPDAVDLNYFRGVSSARAKISSSNQYEHWLISEVSRCYTGCSDVNKIHRMAVYRSVDSGTTWMYQGLMKVNGKEYGQWGANDALLFDPTKSATEVDTVNPANNRFIMWGEKKSDATEALILVSADGINYSTVNVSYPIAADNPCFVSITQTPFGFHMTAKSRWSTSLKEIKKLPVRHLFSKDLKTWKILETDSAMRNLNYYKGIHLRYEPASDRLWAFASCEDSGRCGYLGYFTPKDFAD